MGMVASAHYTAEMVRALPEDGNRYETVHGELLVTPAPRVTHQRIIRRLVILLDPYIERESFGELFPSPADLSWDGDILVQPDLFVVRIDEARTSDWTKMRSLLLVIEVLSPSTKSHDRHQKRRLYQEQGIPAYWIVDPENEAIEVWTPDAAEPTIHKDAVTWHPAGAASELTVDLKELFKPSR